MAVKSPKSGGMSDAGLVTDSPMAFRQPPNKKHKWN